MTSSHVAYAARKNYDILQWNTDESCNGCKWRSDSLKLSREGSLVDDMPHTQRDLSTCFLSTCTCDSRRMNHSAFTQFSSTQRPVFMRCTGRLLPPAAKCSGHAATAAVVVRLTTVPCQCVFPDSPVLGTSWVPSGRD